MKPDGFFFTQLEFWNCTLQKLSDEYVGICDVDRAFFN